MKRSKKRVWECIMKDEKMANVDWTEAHNSFLKIWNDPKRPSQVGMDPTIRAQMLIPVIEQDMRMTRAKKQIATVSNP